MNEVQKIIQLGAAELTILFRKMPEAVKNFDVETLHVCNVLKLALGSSTAEEIEATLQLLIPNTWVTLTVAIIEKALGVAISELTNIAASSDDTIIVAANKLVDYLKTLSPKMANAGLLKCLSSIFQAIDPALNEVSTDTAAQLVYAKSVVSA